MVRLLKLIKMMLVMIVMIIMMVMKDMLGIIEGGLLVHRLTIKNALIPC